MVRLEKTVETDEDLRNAISLGGFIPIDKVWVETNVDSKELVSKDIGDETKTLKEQFYQKIVNEKTYTLVAKSNTTPDGTPNGNYEVVSEEVFKSWADKYSIENFCIEPPKEVIKVPFAEEVMK